MRTYVRALGQPEGRRGGGAPAAGLPRSGGGPPLRRPRGARHPLLRGPREVGAQQGAGGVPDAVPLDDQPVQGMQSCVHLLPSGDTRDPHGGRRRRSRWRESGRRRRRSTAPCATTSLSTTSSSPRFSPTGRRSSPAHRITLEDGTELVASGDHRFLTAPSAGSTSPEGGTGRRPHLTPRRPADGPRPSDGTGPPWRASRRTSRSCRSSRSASSSRCTTSPPAPATSSPTASSATTASPAPPTPISTSTPAATSSARSSSRSTCRRCCAPSWRGRRWKGEHVALGTNTDPYQWVEGRYKLMPGIWEAFRDFAQPLLGAHQVAARCCATCRCCRRSPRWRRSAPTCRCRRSTRRPGAPPSRTRPTRARGSRRCAELNRAGIPTGVLIAPLMPGINDSPEQVERDPRARRRGRRDAHRRDRAAPARRGARDLLRLAARAPARPGPALRAALPPRRLRPAGRAPATAGPRRPTRPPSSPRRYLRDRDLASRARSAPAPAASSPRNPRSSEERRHAHVQPPSRVVIATEGATGTDDACALLIPDPGSIQMPLFRKKRGTPLRETPDSPAAPRAGNSPIARQLRVQAVQRARRARWQALVLMPLLAGVIWAYSHRKELFGVDLPVRLASASGAGDPRLGFRPRPRTGARALALPADGPRHGGHGRLPDPADRPFGVDRCWRCGSPGSTRHARRRRCLHRGDHRPRRAADPRQPHRGHRAAERTTVPGRRPRPLPGGRARPARSRAS